MPKNSSRERSGDFIRQKIRNAKGTRQQELNFQNYRMREIPNELFELTELRSLNLADNQIKVVPRLIERLSKLTSLDLSGNTLKSLPASLERLSNLTSLNASKNTMDRIPDCVFNLRRLETLDLGSNSISYIDPKISQLERLATLRLDRNRIEVLPDSIGSLQNLALLDLGNNRLKKLPDSFSQLSKLRLLDLHGNVILDLPPALSELYDLQLLDISSNGLSFLSQLSSLNNLKKLDVSRNRLRGISPSISALKNLTSLDLGTNLLTELPPSIVELTNLTYLDLGTNDLQTLPLNLSPLVKLRWLDVSRNRLRALPSSLCQLPKLLSLDFVGNPLEVPPVEVVKNGLEAIRNYFRQIDERGVDHLYEAKVLIVGEGGAGKTTLARKIENPDYELREEDSTRGIEIVRWSFPTDNDQTFRLSIWDFGGQEIYHATHQFFLTRRSLYLLVADTRREDTDFYYWLSIIELLSDNSPLLIIKNEKQNRTREINENQFRGQFSNFKETIATNLATKRGLDQVIAEIKHHVKNLPHVGAALPKTWIRVREALEVEPRNYISLVEFFEVCDQNGFTNLEDKLQLSGYLHDLGVCLHFQEDPLLMKTVILKPKWGTDAVYKVLDNNQIKAKLGRFTKSDLRTIWQENEYEGMRDELLQLMMNFKLCYRIPHSEFYIAPQLLSENQPQYDWSDSGNLVIRYTYEFMPKGILTQFIVALHQMIYRGCVWKSGVIVEKDETRAEVIEFYGKRELRIRVSGKHKTELSTIVTYEIDQIHETYERLKFNKLIPCNCVKCVNEGESEKCFYPFETLRRFGLDGQRQIQCQKSYEMVTVRSLIDAVDDGGDRSDARSDQVFISYSHRDSEWRKKLEIMLKPLTRRHGISVWSDSRIESGDNWKAEIELALNSSKVAVLLVSSHFLASDFIVEHELPTLLNAARQGGLTVLWVAVSDSLYKDTEIAEYQAANNPSEPLDSLSTSEQNRVLINVCEKIKECLNRSSSH